MGDYSAVKQTVEFFMYIIMGFLEKRDKYAGSISKAN